MAASGSIPWLLIAVKSKSGSGTLDKADYVLRVATDGGAAPTEPPNGESYSDSDQPPSRGDGCARLKDDRQVAQVSG